MNRVSVGRAGACCGLEGEEAGHRKPPVKAGLRLRHRWTIEALCRLGAKLKLLALDKPEAIRQFMK